MTAESKVFIELSDIIGLRLQCRNCGCSLLIDVTREDGPINDLLSANSFLLSECPTCRTAWIAVNPAARAAGTASFDAEFKKLFRTIRDLRKLLPNFGCSMTLEIKQQSEA